eukprot:TRINITY_DN55399_c0_g1_i1.p1 TRINITY_DN55399_c0_g1~~TRINITY_DN55399_c0_g1_i1.p1  ORF type:complete len:953 (+),score=110.67 TRINITY_DN55399_c0_g1_i1:79-2937(+)
MSRFGPQVLRTASSGSHVDHHHRNARHGVYIADHASAEAIVAGTPDHWPNLPITRHLNRRRCDKITDRNIEELHEALDPQRTGACTGAALKDYLLYGLRPGCPEEDADMLFVFADKDVDGSLSVKELIRAFRAPPFRQLIEKSRTLRIIEDDNAVDNDIVVRDTLHTRLSMRVETNDAFKTLPISIVGILIFIFIVLVHLDVWRRHRVSAGIVDWINGYGNDLPGPYLQDHVGDAESAWVWLESSGLQSVLAECSSKDGNEPQCRVGPRNILIGDVCMHRGFQDGSKQSVWLLNSEKARNHLAVHTGDYIGAARAQLQTLLADNWTDFSTEELRLSFITYADRVSILTSTEVVVRMNNFGTALRTVKSLAVGIDPYRYASIYILDILYLLTLLYPMYSEMRDIICICLDIGIVAGMRDYLNFWNCVDWLSVSFGLVNCIIWVSCCLSMKTSAIDAVLADGEEVGRIVIPDVMNLNVEALSALAKDLNKIINLFLALQVTMGFNTISLMLKFFKAFRANPQLRVVTDTLQRAAVDICHFLIVFLVVYTSFALGGNILFGGDLAEFCSVSASMNTAFTTLMGDFGWYAEIVLSKETFGSGIPKFAVVLWFACFNVFVLLILVNMLMAIVLDHYCKITQEIQDSPETISLLTQSWRWVKELRGSKGFISIDEMVRHMDATLPAHPEQRVTEGTLLRAFPKMPEEQAVFLMEWLRTLAGNSETEMEEDCERLRYIQDCLENVVEEVRRVALSVDNGSVVIKRQQSGSEAIVPGLDRSSSVDMLASQAEVCLHAALTSPLPMSQQASLVESIQSGTVSSPKLTSPPLVSLQLPQSTNSMAAEHADGSHMSHFVSTAANQTASSVATLPFQFDKELRQLADLPTAVQDLRYRIADLPETLSDVRSRIDALTGRLGALSYRRTPLDLHSSYRAKPKFPRERPSLFADPLRHIHRNERLY